MARPSQVSGLLRDIADRIDGSRRPSRALVASAVRKVLAAVSQYNAKLTDYEGMSDASGMSGMDGDAIWAHLDSGPDAAAVMALSNGNVAIWNKPDMSGFFFQMLPLDDPGEAEEVAGRDPGVLMNAIL